MNCYVHEDKSPIGTCVGCGKFICESCATEINGKLYCKSCIQEAFNSNTAVTTTAVYHQNPLAGEKNWLVALLLCLFLGGIGAHRFYVGKIGTGILQLLTLGGFGIWSLIDLIIIIVGNFRDAQGNLLVRQ